MKRMKNLSTGLIWEVDGDLLKRLLSDDNYKEVVENVEEVKKEKPKVKPTKKKVGE